MLAPFHHNQVLMLKLKLLLARGWRFGRIVQTAILVVTVVAVILAEWSIAPWAWDTMTYALSYAEGHVTQGYWDRGMALVFILESGLRIFAPPAALAACPVLIGWFMRRMSHR